MTPALPTIAMDGKYSITQTCAILGIHRDTLRKYTDSGEIRCGVRRSTGKKFYLGSDIFKFFNAYL